MTIENAELVAIAGAAAAALVGEMIKDSWSSMRAAAARLFHYGGAEEEQRQLNRLDEDQAHIGSLDAATVRERWQRRLITLVEDYPEALQELSALASQDTGKQTGTTNQNASGNTGPVIQIGRDSFGGVNIGKQ